MERGNRYASAPMHGACTSAPIRARGRHGRHGLDAAVSLLAWRRSSLAELELVARFTRAVDHDLTYARRLYQLGDRRVHDLRIEARK